MEPSCTATAAALVEPVSSSSCSRCAAPLPPPAAGAAAAGVGAGAVGGVWGGGGGEPGGVALCAEAVALEVLIVDSAPARSSPVIGRRASIRPVSVPITSLG